ncbi:MAG: hypothetical protein DMF85_04240 [Acidobacteria bacterium]|nr:MAG: hypothetical protein DMF85_04240 [Acidobacteriota bacterium]
MSTPPPGTEGTTHPHGSLHNPDVAHESSDINVRGVIWFLVTLVVVAALVYVSMWAMMRVLDKIEARNDPQVSPLAAPAGELPPEPRLQTTPWADLRVFRAAEEKALSSYGWIDQKNGVAYMPIEKAKELLLQRGLPARASADVMEGTYVASSGESDGGRSIPAGQPDQSSAVAAKPAPPSTPPAAAKKGGLQALGSKPKA